MRLGGAGDESPNDVTTVGEATPTPAEPASGEPPLGGPLDVGFSRVELGSEQVPAEPNGVLFVNIESGAREFWTYPVHVPAGDGYYTFSADPTHRWLKVEWSKNGRANPPAIVIAERQSGESYEFDNAHWVLVSGPSDGRLIAQSRADPTDVRVIDLASAPTGDGIAVSLPLERAVAGETDAVLLGNGKTLLIAPHAEGALEPGKVGPRRLFAIDLTTGKATEPGVEAKWLFLRRTPDGGARAVALDAEWKSYSISRDGAITGSVAVDVSDSTLAMGNRYDVSPDGRWLTWQEQLPLHVQAGVGLPWHWPVVMLADLDSGEVVLRVLRADPIVWLGDEASVHATGNAASVGAIVWQQWLRNDGPAFMVMTPGNRVCDQCIYYVNAAPGRLGLLKPDGSLADQPTQPVGNFAKALQGLVPGNLGLSRDHTELRAEGVLTPGRDFGGGVSSLPLPAIVQQPPFSDGVRLEVNAGGDGLNLRSRPSSGVTLVGTLAEAEVVTVTDGPCPGESTNAAQCSAVLGPSDGNASTYWIHVTTDAGISGWASADYLTWATSP